MNDCHCGCVGEEKWEYRNVCVKNGWKRELWNKKIAKKGFPSTYSPSRPASLKIFISRTEVYHAALDSVDAKFHL